MIKYNKLPNTEDIMTAVKNNDGYCPCSPIKTEATKCMCKKFREQEAPAICHCGLYEKVIVENN